ncbi:MAG TPA: thiol:disulfide interchange protein DsbA/DsbL [Noviherbaspirillum sp.]|uniref:thiol:disulfide interchange protein DsbA/DsbL n=1 Tax=Noviherbaspirillum sp. TaxID=1926288 RepID=UPI002B462129|nr:thiol:disulfide interchange protein DsbA/DsbL [Noviherbaspirillum sp.]HJV83933.1 thiol:disulfide interchange protein DsbA/DsbL [Noviherbaspirillum sp.]
MRFLKHALAALTIGLVAFGAAATPTNPQPGVDYRVLDKPQSTDSGKKVEVTEFFWYSCPHCNAFEPDLEAWVKKQGDNIVFKRVPVAFRDSMIPQQKLYYALEALGKVDDLHVKVFNAIHVQHQRLDTDNSIADFVAKNGVDKKKFLDVYNSFGVQSKAKRAAQLQQDYQVDGVPLVAIDGRFLTSPSIVGATMGNRPEAVLFEATLQVMDALVAKVAKEKGGTAAAPAPHSPVVKKSK